MLRSPLLSKPTDPKREGMSRKPSRCKECKVKFTPEEREKGNPVHLACIPAYADKRERIALRKRAAAAKKAARAEKVADKATLKAMRPVKAFKADTQDDFNEYIRTRDAHLPCVSCGATNPPMTPGGQWDAGHFLSRGSHPELAFDEDNCHKQCKRCNAGGGRFSHKARTVNADYEVELLKRIGPERLARLKGPHPVVPLDRDELVAIAATYRAKTRELKARE